MREANNVATRLSRSRKPNQEADAKRETPRFRARPFSAVGAHRAGAADVLSRGPQISAELEGRVMPLEPVLCPSGAPVQLGKLDGARCSRGREELKQAAALLDHRIAIGARPRRPRVEL